MITKSHRNLQSETILQFNELPLQQKQAWFSDKLIILNYILCKRRHFSYSNLSLIGTVLCLFLRNWVWRWCAVFVHICFLSKSSSNLETNNFLPSSCHQSQENTTGQVLNLTSWQSLSFFFFYVLDVLFTTKDWQFHFFFMSEGKYKKFFKIQSDHSGHFVIYIL